MILKKYRLSFFFLTILLFGCENGPEKKETSQDDPSVSSSSSLETKEEEKNTSSQIAVDQETAEEMRQLLKFYDQGSKAEWDKARTKLANWPDERYKVKAMDALCLMLFNRFRITGARVTVQRAQEEFKKIGKPAVPYLLLFMSNPKIADNIARKYCSETLALIGLETLPEIAKALKEKGDSRYHYDLIVTLGDLKHPSVIPVLLEHAKDSDYGKRSYVAESLGKVPSPQAISPLLNFLEDEDEFVREQAVRAFQDRKKLLEQSGQMTTVVQKLKSLKKETSPQSDLYQAINKTLRALQG